MLKIIIPIAGSSESFYKAGYNYPKPLIEIQNKLMIEHALENPSKIEVPHQFIFIIKNEDANKYHLDNTLKILMPDSKIIKLKNSTRGALCSVLMAVDFINEDDNLLILNCDQIIDYDFNIIQNYWLKADTDAGMVVFNAVHPRWSYVRLDKNKKVVQTAEKNPISRIAIAGYYYFKSAQDFINASYETIFNDDNYEENYFISPVINSMILKNKSIDVFEINSNFYHSFYSPKMLNEYK